ncbi:MAG: hypothetical protein K6F15_01590 [Treponema sp.]|nr:hypothetical protein [Treponema sp.]
MKKVLFLPVLLLAALSGCKDSKSNDNLLLLKQELVSKLQGGFHYRNVIGYKQDGFWIFTWKYIKVLDGNRVDANNINGTWEAQIPLYQIAVFNTARR